MFGVSGVSRSLTVIFSFLSPSLPAPLMVIIINVSISPLDCESLHLCLPRALAKGLAKKCSINDVG